jgi:hypothetical protein
MSRRKFPPLATWLRQQDPTTLLGGFGAWVLSHHPRLLYRTSNLLVLEGRMEELEIPYPQREAVRSAYFVYSRARADWERLNPVYMTPKQKRLLANRVQRLALVEDAQAADAPFYPVGMPHPAPARYGVH